MRNGISRMALAGIILWGLAGCSGGDSPTTPGNQSHNNTPPALPSVSTMKPVLNFYDMPVPTLDQQTLSTGKPSDARYASVSACDCIGGAPCTSPTPYDQNDKLRDAVIAGSFCRNDPAAVLRGLT